MNIKRVCVGGWFQRTTLHLSEIYDFCKEGRSQLDLDSRKLKAFQDALSIAVIEWMPGSLDSIQFTTHDGVQVNIFEDGLIILGIDAGQDIKSSIETITSYYEKKLSPGLSYIFSLGAPVPKELANIQVIYPYFIITEKATKPDIIRLFSDFKEEKRVEIKKSTFEIYRGNQVYVINSNKESLETIERFIQEQVFIREFKNQLHRYLNLHRIIWEKIADVKERGKIRGDQVGELKDKIEGYNKTINLIDARINQMGSYILTREAIVKKDKAIEKFVDVLQFKYETLSDTLVYVKHIWAMTKNYVSSAIDLFSDIQAASTETSVSNLTIVTSIGVGASLISLFTEQPPEITLQNLSYVVILAFIGYLADRIVKRVAMKRMYEISDIDADKNIK